MQEKLPYWNFREKDVMTRARVMTVWKGVLTTSRQVAFNSDPSAKVKSAAESERKYACRCGRR